MTVPLHPRPACPVRARGYSRLARTRLIDDLGVDDFRAQAFKAFDNLRLALADAGKLGFSKLPRLWAGELFCPRWDSALSRHNISWNGVTLCFMEAAILGHDDVPDRVAMLGTSWALRQEGGVKIFLLKLASGT